MPVHPFDLQTRAALAVRSLTALTDPQRDGLMYFLADWRARPPRADHGLWDCGDGSGRHVDALSLARSILPSTVPEAVQDEREARLEAWMLHLLGAEGLSWLPNEPWAAPWGTDMLLSDWDPADTLAEVSWAQRGTLLGLTTRFTVTGDGRYRAAGQRMVDGLTRIALTDLDGFYYPEGYYRSGGWHDTEPGRYGGIEEYNAAVVMPLVRFFSATGYEPALLLAEGIARFALKHTRGYQPDGRLQTGAHPDLEAHLHTRTNFILGVLELGIKTRRPEYIAWARQEYDCVKEWGTDFGWFPEGLGQRHGELCCTTDMLECALLLGQHVSRRYYADAERMGRNHLLESQFLSLEGLQQAVGSLPPTEYQAPNGGLYSTTMGVLESQVGGFASRSTLNDAFHLDATSMMQCCNAAGTRGLYDLWHSATEVAQGQPHDVWVHLRLSVETPHISVVSCEPDLGCLVLTPRLDCTVRCRVPDGEQVALLERDHGDSIELRAEEGYVSFEAHSGECVKLRYPLREYTADYCVGTGNRTLSCTASWRGETVMRIDPPGTHLPLYGRRNDVPPVHALPPAAGTE